VLVMMTGLGLLTGSSIMAPTTGGCWQNTTCRAARVGGRRGGVRRGDMAYITQGALDLGLQSARPTGRPPLSAAPLTQPNPSLPRLQNLPTPQISGAVIAPTSVVLMAYALYMYKKRASQILRRETVRYDDQAGPTALTLLLVAVTVTAIALAASSLRGPW
jgi:hypothetical protein